jgi:membrane-associated phospholipid phosphatase
MTGKSKGNQSAVNHSSNGLVSKNSKSLSGKINELLLPVVTSDQSVEMVANFQRLCGLQADGTVTNRFLNIYFRTASLAGEEIFSLMPFLFWICLPVAMPYTTNFFVSQIAGQLAKDFFKLPRPVSLPGGKNPIIKLDTHFETEYGLPSTHTIAGLLPISVMLVLVRHGMDISWTAWGLSVLYFVSVALSRLYLGVHSVYDLIAGALMGVTITFLLHVYGDALDVLLYQYSGAVYVQIVILLLFIVAYPRGKAWTASFGTAAQMAGPFFGVGVSFW